uniref:Uncharacterized protein n=1 Tax=Aegilops tauschii subsp. strangulata TaxID=200361 RepID=A0A453CWS7_AEGTS
MRCVKYGSVNVPGFLGGQMPQTGQGSSYMTEAKEIQSGYKIFLCYPMYDASGEMGGNSLACQHERHRPYTLKDTFVRLDLTLSAASVAGDQPKS